MGVVETVSAVVVTSLITSILQSVFTVRGLNIHFEYLRKDVDRAHKRIDQIERR